VDLNEVLTNPLFFPLLVAIITIISNAVFLYWLRKWQYRAEYIITNVQKTYIPVVSEINDGLEHLNRFLEAPSSLKWTFETLEATKKSGLFEFIRSHDQKLYEKLTLFYDTIRPRFGELNVLQEKTKQAIRADWTQHIRNVVSDGKAREYAGMFVNEVLTDHMFIQFLNGRTEGFSRTWNEKLYSLSRSHNLFVPYVKVAPDKIMVSRTSKTCTFDVSEDEIPKLIQLSQPKLKELHDFYNQVRDLVNKEVVRSLVPMMQKYITNPLS